MFGKEQSERDFFIKVTNAMGYASRLEGTIHPKKFALLKDT